MRVTRLSPATPFACCTPRGGISIETLRQELGHSDITTTQIYLRSANTKSDRHRARINEADRFSLAATCKPFLRRAVTDPSRKEEIACIQ